MSKSANGLIEFAKSKIGTPYVYGAKGTILSEEQIQALQDKYGHTCVWDSDLEKAGQVCVDCSGLISWYTGIIRGSSAYKTTAVQVIPIAQRSNAHIGYAVWMQGHIGIYLGNNQYIAADGSAYGVRIANLSQNGFTHLLKLCDIEYTENAVTSPVQVQSARYTVGRDYKVQVNSLNIRTGPGTNCRKKAKGELTASGQRQSNSKGQYNAGTIVTCQETANVGNDIWIKTPSGWLCGYYQGTSYIG